MLTRALGQLPVRNRTTQFADCGGPGANPPLAHRFSPISESRKVAAKKVTNPVQYIQKTMSNEQQPMS